ncbi:cytochrome c3 family protein [Ferrimonas sp. YFM]|uniref:cytochrome c3 family protein n=1 Tax=Ferrimonas sp. YFM TaxID=3028878 RepID=UPI0025725B34|nr:cytochrome c3 family protein [Ferrimonas sp. YFM]BDY04939.1 cytochrome c [Ferrimonas sp. YFM]
MMSMDRRNALKNIIGITTCAAGATLVPSFANAAEEAWSLTPADLGTLAYAPIDPMKVAKLAYNQDVRNKGCMYQVFHALITALAESESPDAAKFAAIPTAMSVYGSGGIFGQGTICGNNNAAGMFFKLINIKGESASAHLASVSAYYEQTALPLNSAEFLAGVKDDRDTDLTPEVFATKVGEPTIAKSLLCHASLTRWADANDMAIKDKGMRCQLLSASMAYKIAEILNTAYEAGDMSVFPGKTPATTGCSSCHNTASTTVPSVMAGMECDTCHGND